MLKPLQAIRKKCLECCSNHYKEVRFCHLKDCPLHEYRLGTRPKRSKKEQHKLSNG